MRIPTLALETEELIYQRGDKQKEDVRRVIEFWEGSSLFLTWTIAA